MLLECLTHDYYLLVAMQTFPWIVFRPTYNMGPKVPETRDVGSRWKQSQHLAGSGSWGRESGGVREGVATGVRRRAARAGATPRGREPPRKLRRIVFTLNFVMWVKVKPEFSGVCGADREVDSQLCPIDFHHLFIKCFQGSVTLNRRMCDAFAVAFANFSFSCYAFFRITAIGLLLSFTVYLPLYICT